MALGNLFKLAKLTLVAYKGSTRDETDKLGELEVQYNPETLSLRHESVFQHDKNSEDKGRFWYSPPRKLEVALVFDGTNVSLGIGQGRHRTVAERIQQLLGLCYYQAESKVTQSKVTEPSYLKLTWDKGVLGPGFDCRLESVDIKYTAFDRDGSPLHAELAAVFVESLVPKQKTSPEAVSSPDLSHRRVVRSGDTLPLLCRDIYGSDQYYLRVAEVNGLDDFRALRPGQELLFPPLERGGGN
jgi:hypothetical protein